MVEQPQRSMDKHNPMLIRRLDALLIHNAPTWRRQIPHSALPRPVHIIREWKERVARTRHALQLCCPFLLLLHTQSSNSALKHALPLCLLTAFKLLPAHVQIDGVGLLGALDAPLEWKTEDARVVTEPPEVSFATCETGTVDTRLLPGADANDSATKGVGDAV